MKILGMDSMEYINSIRENGQAKCPECEDGVVFPIGNAKSTHHFHCNKCRFRIEECMALNMPA